MYFKVISVTLNWYWKFGSVCCLIFLTHVLYDSRMIFTHVLPTYETVVWPKVYVIIIIIIISAFWSDKCLVELPQAPVLFQGIGHSVNPANSLVSWLHFLDIEASSIPYMLNSTSKSLNICCSFLFLFVNIWTCYRCYKFLQLLLQLILQTHSPSCQVLHHSLDLLSL